MGSRRDSLASNRGDRERDRDRDIVPFSTSRSVGALPSYSSNWGGKGTITTLSRNHSTDSRSMIGDTTRMSLAAPGGYLTAPSAAFLETKVRGGYDDRNSTSSSSRGFNTRDRDRDRGERLGDQNSVRLSDDLHVALFETFLIL
jgi:hypothetical protein